MTHHYPHKKTPNELRARESVSHMLQRRNRMARNGMSPDQIAEAEAAAARSSGTALLAERPTPCPVCPRVATCPEPKPVKYCIHTRAILCPWPRGGQRSAVVL